MTIAYRAAVADVILPVMDVALRKAITVAEFIAWAEAHEAARTELINGKIVHMPAEQVGHTRAKSRIAEALAGALMKAGVAGEAFISGLSVPIDLYTAYEPDGLVRLGTSLPSRTMTVADPVIVVEVISPTSAHTDTSAKLIGYFKLASVRHYLVIDPEARTVTHHARGGDGVITARALSEGTLRLDPPGLAVEIADLLD